MNALSWQIAMVALVLVSTASVFAPPPRRPIPPGACMAPLILGALGFLAALMLLPVIGLFDAFRVAMLAVTLVMPAFWIARAPYPDPPPDDSGGGGGGGGGTKRPPRHPGPGGVDWEAFDRARARWTHAFHSERDDTRVPA
jgi:hypothetical protein